jgi:3-methyladenine DNA glycosylase AlkD
MKNTKAIGNGIIKKRIMTPDKLFNEIRAFCKKNADDRIVQKYAKYFIEGYDAYGVDGKLSEEQRKIWFEKYKDDFCFDGFLKLGDLLVKDGKYEEVFYAIWFASKFQKEFSSKTLNRFYQWIDIGVKNWAHSDVMSGEILSPFLIKSIVSLEAFSDWRKSKNKWHRRAVPVTMIKYLRNEPSINTLLDFIEPIMMDKEKVVRQGLGWFLRETWKRNPAPVEKFLLKWKDRCGRLIIQYATEKMKPMEKEKFRKIKENTNKTKRIN